MVPFRRVPSLNSATRARGTSFCGVLPLRTWLGDFGFPAYHLRCIRDIWWMGTAQYPCSILRRPPPTAICSVSLFLFAFFITFQTFPFGVLDFCLQDDLLLLLGGEVFNIDAGETVFQVVDPDIGVQGIRNVKMGKVLTKVID
ncbi:hypothetical protein CHT98_04445 [Azospirillum brasilense]|uniref:Uncharacterized protein n=1 Tax=Azospirillum brasilense TaxID=192 RepID=A0A235HIU3_AZOBR|nr:hypothetical protein CHT98_04445 [Azospirillum brasilense]